MLLINKEKIINALTKIAGKISHNLYLVLIFGLALDALLGLLLFWVFCFKTAPKPPEAPVATVLDQALFSQFAKLQESNQDIFQKTFEKTYPDSFQSIPITPVYTTSSAEE